MTKKAILVLEDGSIFEGHSFGADVESSGEVVFNTSMTGYQEVLTDPSYAGQIVTLTYPLLGNYGINKIDIESVRIQVRGFVVREDCSSPSHWQSIQMLGEYLANAGIPGIGGIDTRAVTRKLRATGVMMGIVTTELSPSEALQRLKGMPYYGDTDFVRGVSTDSVYTWDSDNIPAGENTPRIAVIDCGVKYNILRILRGMGCDIIAMPCTATADEVLSLKPDGVLLSPGPGDPALLGYMLETVRTLVEAKPVMGICLGLQLLGRAFGADTFKLKFGHRGANHPVRDLDTGRVYITAQNHGYAVNADTVGNDLVVSHINLNDGTVEGLRHRELPVFAIQYHSEASPGPHDNMYLFRQFVETVKKQK